MERVRFEYNIVTVLRLTRKEIEQLAVACLRHYDLAVRELVIPGKGAVINAARNTLDTNTLSADVRASYRELDTMVKACEMGLPELHDRLGRLLQEAGQEYVRLNRLER